MQKAEKGAHDFFNISTLPGQRLRANLVWKSQASLSRYSSEITTTIRLHLHARRHIIVDCKKCKRQKLERREEKVDELRTGFISGVNFSMWIWNKTAISYVWLFLTHLETFHFYFPHTHTHLSLTNRQTRLDHILHLNPHLMPVAPGICVVSE